MAGLQKYSRGPHSRFQHEDKFPDGIEQFGRLFLSQDPVLKLALDDLPQLPLILDGRSHLIRIATVASASQVVDKASADGTQDRIIYAFSGLDGNGRIILGKFNNAVRTGSITYTNFFPQASQVTVRFTSNFNPDDPSIDMHAFRSNDKAIEAPFSDLNKGILERHTWKDINGAEPHLLISSAAVNLRNEMSRSTPIGSSLPPEYDPTDYVHNAIKALMDRSEDSSEARRKLEDLDRILAKYELSRFEISKLTVKVIYAERDVNRNRGNIDVIRKHLNLFRDFMRIHELLQIDEEKFCDFAKKLIASVDKILDEHVQE